MSPQTTGRGLDADKVFVGLADYGLFTDKIPPCFTSNGLSVLPPKNTRSLLTETDPDKIKQALARRDHDYVRYSALRDTMVPRQMGIPHPESHIVQALAIKRHWDKIKRHCAKPAVPVSRLFARRLKGKPQIFKMTYKGAERSQLEETEISFRTGAKYKVEVDISACFPSIYTHSIPWALHGRRKAKTNRKLDLGGNLLDRVTQNTKDGQTNGLLIGPHASNILAEIILTDVDATLLKKGYKKLYRTIDDYTFYANSHAAAEAFIRDLGMALREYQLSINERKTRITPVPCPENDGWIRELHGFQFSLDLQGKVRFDTVRHFLDLALHLADRNQNYRILNYAIKMVPYKKKQPNRLNARAKRLFVQEAINLALAYPYLAPIMEHYVFGRHNYRGIAAAQEAFANELLDIGIEKIHPDSIAYALYYALKFNFNLRQHLGTLEGIVDIDDCVCDVLLLEYAKRRKLTGLKKKIVKRANNLKNLDPREGDAFWLLVYQVWSENDLRGNHQAYLADLKRAGFSFLAI